MTTTGPLELGLAQVKQTGTGENIGYVYTEPTEKGQLQRWFLRRAPGNSFEVRSPPATMGAMSQSDWRALVVKEWTPGAFYVRAQANIYHHGDGTNGTWMRIPPADLMPKPTYHQVPGSEFQLDHTNKFCLDIIQESVKGMAYSIGSVTNDANAEYWMLTAGFQPAGAGASFAVAPGLGFALAADATAKDSRQAFIDEVNKTFGPGCIFAIIGCLNYTGASPPANV